MIISAISKIYWNQVKAGSKNYDDVIGEDKKAQVVELATQDVQNGVITPRIFEGLIGLPYEGEEEPVAKPVTDQEEYPVEDGDPYEDDTEESEE